MAQSAPGKHFREGVSLVQAMKMFSTDEKAEQWFIDIRWPEGIICPYCAGTYISPRLKHPTMPYRCNGCRKYFSVKTGTAMQGSKLGYQVWAMSVYILTVGLNGTSSMKLHRDMHVTQKTAWYLAHRIRLSWETKPTGIPGPVEVDETYIGGRESNKHGRKKLLDGRGYIGKEAVVGVKSRPDNTIHVSHVSTLGAIGLQREITHAAAPGATVYSDAHAGYLGLKAKGYAHESVKHNVNEYVRGQAHTNGVESFWAGLKRGYYGTYIQMSGKHLQRYVNEFAGRHNARPLNTLDQMARIVKGLEGKRLPYKALTRGRAAKRLLD